MVGRLASSPPADYKSAIRRSQASLLRWAYLPKGRLRHLSHGGRGRPRSQVELGRRSVAAPISSVFICVHLWFDKWW